MKSELDWVCMDGPYKATGHLQNTPRACLPLAASGPHSALYQVSYALLSISLDRCTQPDSVTIGFDLALLSFAALTLARVVLSFLSGHNWQ